MSFAPFSRVSSRQRQQMPLLLLLLSCFPAITNGCTNILVTPGASAKSEPMLAYAADSANLMGYLYHYPSIESSSSEKTRKVYGWDSGEYLGSIPEYNGRTYNVVGNANEAGLVIGETTFGGIEKLTTPREDAIIDYGSLIYITLQRSATAREAIQTMIDLTDQYGYASEGESFSIVDSNEVWWMEVIGRGRDNPRQGFVYVAAHVPDGYVASHANQARITTFPRDDPENYLYSDDVVSLAKSLGLYESVSGDEEFDLQFSFSDVYDPVTFEGARFCEGRVFSVYHSIVSDPKDFHDKYADYVRGKDFTSRMPLFVKPSKLLTLDDITNAMSSHYEQTPLDWSNDVGAGMYHVPYRPRPLVWKYEEEDYCNERPIGTQQTGWNFIAVVRPTMPPPLQAILWFGVDDTSTSPRYPVYASSTEVSSAYGGVGTQDGNPSPLLDFDISKAFWVQNMVSNFAYARWEQIYPVINEKRRSIQEDFVTRMAHMDDHALKLYESGNIDAAVNSVTDFSVVAGDELHTVWWKFYGQLFAKFRDGYEINEKSGEASCGCDVKSAGMSKDWKKRIVGETAGKYKVTGMANGNGVDDDGHPIHNDDDSAGPNMSTMLRQGQSSAFAVQESDVPKSDESLKASNKLKLKALQ
mmetsp:Transcript_3820/g.5639  ORF Transcript_3820/g.5639 Transcript_3820/m.5639 type:complete len:640 (-) Transcript_3820:59-1978(-)